jgi:hypothetical protein
VSNPIQEYCNHEIVIGPQRLPLRKRCYASYATYGRERDRRLCLIITALPAALAQTRGQWFRDL